MTKANPRHKTTETVEDIGTVAPEDAQQIVPVQSMEVDPHNGARVAMGTPVRSDEEEVQDFLVWLQERADRANVDSMARIAENLRKAQNATSLAELLKEEPTASGKDHIGQAFWAKSFEIYEGEYEDEDLPYFASLKSTDPNSGQEFIMNCGGEKVLVYLQWMETNLTWPILMCFTGKETRKKRVILSIDVLRESK